MVAGVAPASPSISLENKSISSIVGAELPANTTIKLTIANGTFKDLIINTNITSWFGTEKNRTLPEGVTATVTSLDTVKEVATISFSGTTSKAFNKPLKVNIPADKFTPASSTSLVTEDNEGIKFIVTEKDKAKIASTIVNGKIGLTINATVNLILENAIFAISDSSKNISSWFTNLPNGLSATLGPINESNINEVTVTISGSPTDLIDTAIKVTIPSNALNNYT